VLEKHAITATGAVGTLSLLPHYDDSGGLPQRKKRKRMILRYRAQLIVKHSIAEVPINAVAGQIGYR
jgi:hypothetical protein